MSWLRSRIGKRAASRLLAFSLLGLHLILLPKNSSAVECPLPAGAAPALAQRSKEVRLSFLRQSMRDTAALERRYLLGWSLSYAGLAAATWVLVPFYDDPRPQYTTSAWNSATSVAASLLVLTGPMPILRDEKRLERRFQNASRNDPAQDCAVLLEAEQLLQRAAANEASARSAQSHLLGTLTTIGLGLILGYALNRPDSAAMSTTIGIVLDELSIASRPTVGIRRLESYKSGTLTAITPPTFVPLMGLAPIRLTNGYGLALGGVF